MRDAILRCIAESGCATFVRLCREVPGFAGDREISHPTISNLILWRGISAEAIDALEFLKREKKLHFQPTTRQQYDFDGAVLAFPVAKRLSGQDLAKLHWYPVTVCDGPGKSA